MAPNTSPPAAIIGSCCASADPHVRNRVSNVLDVTAVAVSRRKRTCGDRHPSHAGGKAWMGRIVVRSGRRGADALLIEVHPCPADAWCTMGPGVVVPSSGR